MNYFFDTSALIKRYVDEPGSDTVDRIFELAGIIYIADNLNRIYCHGTKIVT